MSKELTLELERFIWAAPDRLELAGEFFGVANVPLDSPTLVLRYGEEAHRLPLLPDDRFQVPVDGRSWDAAFTCTRAWATFDRVELHMSRDVVIDLPEPGAQTPAHARVTLRARPTVDGSGAPQREQAVDLATIQRIEQDLLAALAELDASRQRSAADAERFQQGLAAIRASAEDALALEQQAAQEIRARLDAANEQAAAGMGEVERLQQALDRSEAERSRAEAESRSQLSRLSWELEESRQNSERAGAETERAEAAAADARAEARVLLDRLHRIRDALRA